MSNEKLPRMQRVAVAQITQAKLTCVFHIRERERATLRLKAKILQE